MQGKTFFMDLSRCTACRGCQVACKQWHKLPATPTKQWGSRQNPKDLNFNTYKLVRFSEEVKDGRMQWLFFPEQCRHCIEPPCKGMADGYDERAILHDPNTGAVIFTSYTKALTDIEDPMELCPYNIPRKDPETGVWSKCDMCLDRVQNGMLPACVLSCPTGTMNFGDREDMMALANERLAKVKKTKPQAQLVDADSVRVIVLTEYSAMDYYDNLSADAGPIGPISRKQMLAMLTRPFRSRG